MFKVGKTLFKMKPYHIQHGPGIFIDLDDLQRGYKLLSVKRPNGFGTNNMTFLTPKGETIECVESKAIELDYRNQTVKTELDIPHITKNTCCFIPKYRFQFKQSLFTFGGAFGGAFAASKLLFLDVPHSVPTSWCAIMAAGVGITYMSFNKTMEIDISDKQYTVLKLKKRFIAANNYNHITNYVDMELLDNRTGQKLRQLTKFKSYDPIVLKWGSETLPENYKV